jgi:hypothetical protein
MRTEAKCLHDPLVRTGTIDDLQRQVCVVGWQQRVYLQQHRLRSTERSERNGGRFWQRPTSGKLGLRNGRQ